MTESVREEEVPRAVIEAAELNAIEGGLTPDYGGTGLPSYRPPWWPLPPGPRRLTRSRRRP
jgi:hypothetical protein